MLKSSVLSTETTTPVPVEFSPEGIFVLESRHRKGFRMEDIQHDFLKILYPFEGEGFLITKSRRKMMKNDVAIIPPGLKHRLEDGLNAPLFVYGLCIRRDFLNRYPRIRGLSGKIRLFRHPVWIEELRNLLRSLLIEQSRAAAGEAAWMIGLAWQIIALMIRAESSQDTPGYQTKRSELAAERVRAYAASLPQRFHLDANLNEAAERLGLSRRRFTQLFRQITGESWLSAVRRLRIAHACRLLEQTNRSISAIAFESGYADLSNFYRAFREGTGGFSPRVWRQRHASPVALPAHAAV